jgi:hypothetical protein
MDAGKTQKPPEKFATFANQVIEIAIRPPMMRIANKCGRVLCCAILLALAGRLGAEYAALIISRTANSAC